MKLGDVILGGGIGGAATALALSLGGGGALPDPVFVCQNPDAAVHRIEVDGIAVYSAELRKAVNGEVSQIVYLTWSKSPDGESPTIAVEVVGEDEANGAVVATSDAVSCLIEKAKDGQTIK